MRSIVIDVASLTHDVVLPDGVTGSVFRSYDEALAQSSAPLVYVSTRNHDHLALVLRALASHGLAPESVDYVMLTHIHLDHAGGAGGLMQVLPNAKLTVHPRGARGRWAEPVSPAGRFRRA